MMMRCPACRNTYLKNSWGICFDCFDRLEWLHRRGHEHLEALEGVYVSLFYSKDIRSWIHRYKFQQEIFWAHFFSEALTETAYRYDLHRKLDMIVAVPLSRKRQRERGYNQAEILAKGLGNRLGLPVSYGLKKTLDTPPQSTLNPYERLGNVEGAFYCEQGFQGSKILLVDDVVTTGATLDACGGALKKSGASAVIGIAIASAHG